MKNKLIIIGILCILILSGCSLIEKEIDIGEEDCKEMMSGLLGTLLSEVAEKDCSSRCSTEGYSYKKWKCSENDTLVCVCSKI